MTFFFVHIHGIACINIILDVPCYIQRKNIHTLAVFSLADGMNEWRKKNKNNAKDHNTQLKQTEAYESHRDSQR